MEATVTLAERELAYNWQRSARRRTTAITIHPERGVVVHTPRNFPLGRVETLLRSKSGWIFRHLEKMAAQRAARPLPVWREGEVLPYRGVGYQLTLTEGGAPPGVWLADGKIHVALRPDGGAAPLALRAREAALAWYRERARQVLRAQVAFFQPAAGAAPAAVRIKAQKHRWGSCSARGAVNLNWRLILAPPPVLDYVVVHELCHLTHLNHSPRFWALVEQVLPDYRESRAWLRERGRELEL